MRLAFLFLLLMVAVCSGGTSREDLRAAQQSRGEITAAPQEAQTFKLPLADGFRGIWYCNQPSHDAYRYKYSGGMATYPQQHLPIAVYSTAANKTFFVFGGRTAEKNELLHMISYYDHATGEVARPRILLNKKTSDAHDNPTLSIDGAGRLWIFSNSHGTGRPSYIHRSTRPFEIDEFELVLKTNFSYGQPWFLPERGFVFLHTRYTDGRRYLFEMASAGGREWSEPRPLAKIEKGQYQISREHDGKLVTAFNMHPEATGLNGRTNLYFMQSADGGATWQNAQGDELALPLTERQNAALAINAVEQGELVYLKDIAFTAANEPVVLYLASRGFESGPENGPRTLRTARFDGQTWRVHDVTTTDHNYDYALFSIDEEQGVETWRMLGTTDAGPQSYCTGGEVALWASTDQGATWTKARQLTDHSRWNHNYPRRPHGALPDFFALWADGNPLEESRSRLYFTNRAGTAVWQLPETIEGDAMLVKPRAFATPATVDGEPK